MDWGCVFFALRKMGALKQAYLPTNFEMDDSTRLLFEK